MKLIFCFDGTLNDPEDAGDFSNDTSISNIPKLHLLFGGGIDNEYSAFKDQKSFYYSGVGTRGWKITQWINATLAPSWGDREDILDEATQDLKKSYQKGDKIYIFGFSRGAALARIFAAKIREYCNEVDAVEFLGVFDTVAVIKGSRDLDKDTLPESTILFENGDIGDHIKCALHLVSLDENRVLFQPTLFNKNNRVKEVWFAGAHSDIGGGYWFDGLSDITLKFMCDEIKRDNHLSILEPQEIDYSRINENENERKITLDDIEIHPLPTGTIHTTKRNKLLEKITIATRQVRVDENDRPSGDAIPIIHHTIHERFENVPKYRPLALRDIKYRIMLENGEIEEHSRIGIRGLREFSNKLKEITRPQ